jgi:hypothetical protein
LCYDSKDFSNYLLPLLGGLVEAARVVLLVLLVGAVAGAARDEDVAGRSKLGALLAGGATLAGMVVVLIMFVILDNASSSKSAGSGSGKGPLNFLAIGEIALYMVHAAALFLPAVLALQASSAAGRRR